MHGYSEYLCVFRDIFSADAGVPKDFCHDVAVLVGNVCSYTFPKTVQFPSTGWVSCLVCADGHLLSEAFPLTGFDAHAQGNPYSPPPTFFCVPLTAPVVLHIILTLHFDQSCCNLYFCLSGKVDFVSICGKAYLTASF